MDFKTHNARMVDRFIWLSQLDPAYARDELEKYRKHPDSPNPNILADVKAELRRRAQESTPQSSSTEP